ncbi:MAG TPA: alpha-glucosidase, partial [Chitinophagales bacterium]|nr:alpha-glucosidase [Chitinophagales bacterium]
MTTTTSNWWKSTTVYHIYIRSFLDTNGDGIGDLDGVIAKLDYIQSMGFESIWISPFTESPQKDFGYDISDYQAISPLFGTMQTVEKLLQEVHARGMKLILDMVLNHTSAEHAWFKESASSRDNPKADWYVWKDGKGKDGLQRPNNWRAMAGNRAWIYHPVRKQFYYSGFLPFQPDLNYRNPEVKAAIFNMVRFWLDKGVDGFRLDIISAIYEDPMLQDNPFSYKIAPSDNSLTIFFQHLKNNFLQEDSFGFATELRKVLEEYPNKFMVGETHGDESLIHQFCKYKQENGLHTVFLFKAITTSFNATAYRKMVEKFEKYFPEPLIPTYVFGNHDRTRMFARLKGNIAKAKLLALFQFTARGIPFVYYGEEIGIPRVRIPLRQAQDPIGVRMRYIPQFMVDLSIETLNRDECRTPMQWDNSHNAGFCAKEIKPWLPVSENYTYCNVLTEQNEEHSLLNFYKKIIHYRNNTPAIKSGKLEIAEEYCSKKVLAFYRVLEEKYFIILLNMSDKKVTLPEIKGI